MLFDDFKTILSQIVNTARRCIVPLVAYDIIFKIAAAAIVGPVLAWFFATLISTTGNLSLSNDQILAFTLSPVGLLALILWALTILVALFAEQAGMMFIALGGQQGGQRPSTLAALMFSARQLPALIRLGAWQAGIYLLAASPWAVLLGATYVLLISDYDLNYLVSVRPPVFWLAAAIAALAVGGLLLCWTVLYLRWLLAVPICLFEARQGRAALQASWAMLRGRWIRIAGLLAGWYVFTLGVSAIVGVLIDAVGGWLVKALAEHTHAVIPAVATILVSEALMFAALSFVGFLVHCLLIMNFYSSLRISRDPEWVPEPAAAILALDPRQASRIRYGLTAAAVALFVATALTSIMIVERIGTPNQVTVTAHRGSSLRAPENSLSAIRLAIEEGADYVEIDVQETADGVVVLLHDEDLVRVAGVNKKIWQVTYDEIRELDAGSWFGAQYRGERIPTLEQVMEETQGRIKLYIELKFNGHEKMLTRRVVELVQQRSLQGDCIIASLTYKGLEETRRLEPALNTAYLVFGAVGDLSKLNVDIFSVSAKLATEKLIRSVHRRDKVVHVWTVNDVKQMSALIDLGVSNIITDDPRALVGLLEQRAGLSDVERALLAARNWLRW